MRLTESTKLPAGLSENSPRVYIERNVIALLATTKKEPLNPPSENWLGHCSDRERVRESGLWNQNHVDEAYDLKLREALDHAPSLGHDRIVIGQKATGFPRQSLSSDRRTNPGGSALKNWSSQIVF